MAKTLKYKRREIKKIQLELADPTISNTHRHNLERRLYITRKRLEAKAHALAEQHPTTERGKDPTGRARTRKKRVVYPAGSAGAPNKSSPQEGQAARTTTAPNTTVRDHGGSGGRAVPPTWKEIYESMYEEGDHTGS